MKAILSVVGALALMAGPAIGADLPLKAPLPPPAAVYNWTGSYLGVNAGGTWSSSNSVSTTATSVADFLVPYAPYAASGATGSTSA
jgi:outer membrane immunogenic protein